VGRGRTERAQRERRGKGGKRKGGRGKRKGGRGKRKGGRGKRKGERVKRKGEGEGRERRGREGEEERREGEGRERRGRGNLIHKVSSFPPPLCSLLTMCGRWGPPCRGLATRTLSLPPTKMDRTKQQDKQPCQSR